MSLPTVKILSAIIIFILTLLAAWYPFKKRLTTIHHHDFPAGEAMACGVFLGAGLIHMLSDSNRYFLAQGYDYPIAYLICGSTFLFFLLLEHVGTQLKRSKPGNSDLIAVLSIIMLSVHSLLAGAAVGISDTFLATSTLILAILAHKWAESFALAIRINHSTISLRTGMIGFALFALMAPVGILLGSFVNSAIVSAKLFAPVFTAMAAGTFVYIGTLHGLERATMIERCCDMKEFGYVIIGFTIMAVVAIWT